MFRKTRKKVTSALRALGSLLPTRKRAADRGRVVRPWREDAFHSYPTVGLTPSRALAFIQQADSGYPQLQFELFAEMLQKWPRLAAVETTRRLALTGLDWELLPSLPSRKSDGATVPSGANATGNSLQRSDFSVQRSNSLLATRNSQLAADVVDFCNDRLSSLDRFRDALNHLSSAIGFGTAVAELVWEDAQLVDIVPVPHSRLIADPVEPWRLRVLTEEDPGGGVALDEQPFKWVVHTPSAKPGRHFESGLLRASVLMYVAQNLSFKDWLIYSQIAAMPTRIAQFEPGTPEADKQALLRMLENMGTDAVAIFSKNIDLKLIETHQSGGERPYAPLQQYCNTEITILWLGQHLTTDIQGQGSRAAAEVHDRVREDLLVDDIADEGETIRRDLLTPLVRARFGDGVPIPLFRRSLIESVDTRVLADTLAVAVNDLGIQVPRRWVHRALGIPEPSQNEPVLAARSINEPAPADRSTGDPIQAARSDREPGLTAASSTRTGRSPSGTHHASGGPNVRSAIKTLSRDEK